MSTMSSPGIFAVPIAWLLLGAGLLGDFPYGYYMFLRCAITAIALYLIYRLTDRLSDSVKPIAMGFLLLLAVTYNPFYPVHLGRDVWEVVNVTTMFGLLVVLLMSLFAYKRTETTTERTASNPLAKALRTERERKEIQDLHAAGLIDDQERRQRLQRLDTQK